MPDLQALQKVLTRHHFQCTISPSVDDATQQVLAMIPLGASVGFGGSMSVQSMGLYETLQQRGHAVHWHWMVPQDQRNEARAQAAQADIYLLSANAITQDGEIINTDGSGNRVSSMFFGPKKVIFIIGQNKVCEDLTSALWRVRNVAAPKNAVRLGLSTPCAKVGKCLDCDSPQRMCNVTGILHRPTNGVEMSVILVGEDLGA